MEKSIKSVLNLDRLVFDKIEFKRLGFENESEIEFNIEVSIGKKPSENIYKITLLLKGTKEKEYTIEISLTGFFTFDGYEEMQDDFKETLIHQNTVAIMMPYLRSQVSLLTAQPGVECVVLPPFNVANMVSDD